MLLFIFSMALVNCKTYPPSIEETCVWECMRYLESEESQYGVDWHVLMSRCRDGVPRFKCALKIEYDETHGS